MPKIISFGCSYTAGAEILDHELDPNSDHIKLTRGDGYWNKHFRCRDSAVLADIERRELELSWVGQIARTWGSELDNRAVGGSSLAYTVDSVERAWYNGELERCDLVLIGVTNYARSVFWRQESEPQSWILAWPRAWPNPKWQKKTVFEIFSDRYMISLHQTYLTRLCQISDRLGGRLKMFDMMGMMDHGSAGQLNHTNLCQHKWQEILDSEHTFFDVSMDSLTNQGNRCYGSGHPRLEVHKEFAAWAMDQLDAST